ncbi:MAG: hypothetical protein ACFCUL_09785 [Flavobacteriaceae bacterium]
MPPWHFIVEGVNGGKYAGRSFQNVVGNAARAAGSGKTKEIYHPCCHKYFQSN